MGNANNEHSVNLYRETKTAKIIEPRRSRSPAATVQRRILTKHIQQKYLLCGFAIHAFLATPAYLYGIIVDSDKEYVMRIWPPIIYQAVGQICRSILLHSLSEYRGKPKETSEYRRIFVISSLITCAALTISGYLFSSAWIMVSDTTQIVAITIYGIFGGIGSSLFIAKTHCILEAARPREDKYVRKTIHLCGEAFCQLFLSFVCTSLRTLYGTSQSLFLIGALLINLIPLGLIITRHIEGVFPKRLAIMTTETRFESLQSLRQMNKNTHSITDQMDGIELQPKSWRNPTDPREFHCNYMSVTSDDSFMTYINQHGVEIMEIIPEEDENISIMRSSTATIDNYTRRSIDTSHIVLKSISSDSYSNLEKIQQFSKDVTTHLLDNLLEKIVHPLKRAVFISKLYPATLLQSADVFSYVMCLTVLPGLAVERHALKFAEIPFLFSLLAFPWMCFSLMTPRFGGTLVSKKFKWFTGGCIAKALALLFISVSGSKLLLSVSSVLLGFGQAVTLFLQDTVIQTQMPNAQWMDIKYPLYFTNGLLVLIWGGLAHLVVTKFSFQASVGLAGGLYSLSVLVWNVCIHYCWKDGLNQ